MPSSRLGSIHGRMTSGVACHHRVWEAHTVERRQACHAIIAFEQHKRSNNIERIMISPPLGCTHGRTTSGLACHHRLWATHTVERHRAWHDITALGLHSRSDDVGRDMPSSRLGSTHGRTTSCLACYHQLWAPKIVERRQACHDITAHRKLTWSAMSGVA